MSSVMVALGLSLIALTVQSAMAERRPDLTGGYSPAWSPDGRKIAYTAIGTEIVVMSSRDGTGKRTIHQALPNSAVYQFIRWAPSRRIVFDDVSGPLRSVDPLSRRVRILGPINRSPEPGETFTISSDGTLAALSATCDCAGSNPAAHGAVGIATVGGGSLRLLPKPGNAADYEPSFSPDGRRVVFVRVSYEQTGGPIGLPRLLVEASEGGPPRSLGVSGSWPAWSPDGRWIAFDGPGLGLELVRSSGGKPTALRSAGGLFSWSPDSKRLVFETGKTLGTIDLNGRRRAFRLGRLTLSNSTPHWSPDGTRIAFGASPFPESAGIYVINANGSGLRRLA